MPKSPGDKLYDDVFGIMKDIQPLQLLFHPIIPIFSQLGIALCDYKLAETENCTDEEIKELNSMADGLLTSLDEEKEADNA